MLKRSDLMAERGKAFDAFNALAMQPTLTPEQEADYEAKKKAVTDLDAQIKRYDDAQALSATTAQPVAGQENAKTFAAVETDPYVSDAAAKQVAAQHGRLPGSAKSLVIGACTKTLSLGQGSLYEARHIARDAYGENHPVTKALGANTGTAGAFIVPPDYIPDFIELLRPETVVRASNPRVIPMPSGTATLPGQASPATAFYGQENAATTTSAPTFKQKVASFKKLTSLVPVSNSLMRYANPAVDALVRDDLVEVSALREDLAFLLGDGSASSPAGMISFANDWVNQGGGTIGSWLSTANSTAAANGTSNLNALTGLNGGCFITSNETYTEATVVAELTGLINRLDSANVKDRRRVWIMNPRTYNYLFGLLNGLGLYVFRDELSRGTLYGYPVKKTNQIPTNIWDPTGTNKDCSFVFLVEMSEAMIFDSMSLELAISREGSYVDTNGQQQNAFANDQTLIRAIAEHDFLMRHDGAVAVLQFVRWAPAIQ